MAFAELATKRDAAAYLIREAREAIRR
jgi:hypothetical protein